MKKLEMDTEMLALVRCPDCTGGGFGIDDRLMPFPCGTCSPVDGYGSGKVYYPASLLQLKVAA